MTIRLVAVLLCLGVSVAGQAPARRDLRRTALTTAAPSNEIVRLDIDGDAAGWATTYMVFGEDDDDHRWERSHDA